MSLEGSDSGTLRINCNLDGEECIAMVFVEYFKILQ